MPDDNRLPVAEDPRDIHLRNYHKKEYDISLEVTNDEEVIHTEEYRLQPGSGEILYDFADEIGGYTITARSKSGKKVSDTWTVNNDSTSASVTIGENGELKLLLNPQL